MHDSRGKVFDRKRAAEAALAPADLPEGLSAARRSAQARRIVRHALVLERCLDSARFLPPWSVEDSAQVTIRAVAYLHIEG